MEEYIGVVKIFAGNFAPKYYMFCQGQLLPVAPYQALFSILGTTYGGDGITTFGLPDLRGAAPVGTGVSRFSGTNYIAGQIGGAEKVEITANQLPPHTHTAKMAVSSANASKAVATGGSVIATPGSVSGRDFDSTLGFADGTPDIPLNDASVTVNPAGAGMPVGIMSPYLAMNYIICTEGIYPSRP